MARRSRQPPDKTPLQPLQTPAAAVPAPPKRKPLSKKAQKLISVLSKDPDLTLDEAAARAGYGGGEHRRKTVHSALKSPSVREAFQEALAKHPGLKREKILKRLAEGLDAKVTKPFAHEGRVIDEKEYVDYQTRGSYISLITKLGGLEPPSKSELTGANGKPLIPENPASAMDFSFLAKLSKEDLFKVLEMLAQVMNPKPSSLAATPSSVPIEGGVAAPEPPPASSEQDSAGGT